MRSRNQFNSIAYRRNLNILYRIKQNDSIQNVLYEDNNFRMKTYILFICILFHYKIGCSPLYTELVSIFGLYADSITSYAKMRKSIDLSTNDFH